MLDIEPSVLSLSTVTIGGAAFALLTCWLYRPKKSKEVSVASISSSRPVPAENFRWMAKSDLPDVLAIERSSFVSPFSEADFETSLASPDTMGIIAERYGRIVGHLLYQQTQKGSRILRLAVHPLHRRAGVGRRLIEKLVNRPVPHDSRRFWTSVPESNLPAQLFLRSMGFRALPPARDAVTYRFTLELD